MEYVWDRVQNGHALAFMTEVCFAWDDDRF
jgi:hypothetical protein